MKIRRISELQSYMKANDLSPEELSKQLKISNMTLRRFVKKPGSTAIPEKYHASFDALTDKEVMPYLQMTNAINLQSLLKAKPGDSSTETLMSELAESGKSCNDEAQIEQDTKVKLKDINVFRELKEKVLILLNALRSNQLPLKTRLICLGALAYFINPFDLIPDSIPVIGYLDDFAVLSLAVAFLVKATKELPGPPGPPGPNDKNFGVKGKKIAESQQPS